MTEIAIHEQPSAGIATAAPMSSPQFAQQDSQLLLWAAEARQASQIAGSLAKTAFVPASLRGTDRDLVVAHEITVGNITAAILSGQELGLPPMAAMRSMDIIQGVPALRAHAMRGLVQSRGHKVELVEASPTKVVMRGKRKGERQWQTVEWTIQRAAQLNLTGKPEWKKQPQTMLIARATGEICRLIAADALYAMPYAVEELDRQTAATTGAVVTPATSEEILGMPNVTVEVDRYTDEDLSNGYGVVSDDPWGGDTCYRCDESGHHPDACPTLDGGVS